MSELFYTLTKMCYNTPCVKKNKNWGGKMDLLEESKRIYNGKQFLKEYFETIDQAYLFSNENINGYMPDLTGKDILSVAGSGDHYFNALLNNSRRVILFDINYVSKFIIYLKAAGFTNLDFDVFCTFFGLYSIYNIFDYSIYQSFAKYLNDEASIYWNFLYKLTKNKGYSIYESDLISHYHNCTEELISNNKYFNETEFLRLKKILSNNPEFTFIQDDINNLPFSLIPILNKIQGNNQEKNTSFFSPLSGENCLSSFGANSTKKQTETKNLFDYIFLSNIGTYQRNTTYIKTIKRLAKYLKENGEIYFAYIFGQRSDKSTFYDKLLASNHYYEQQITSNNEEQNHKIYVYRK